MKKKNLISEKDLKDWKDYIKKPDDVIDKENNIIQKANHKNRFKFDLHGYSLSDANNKVKELIYSCQKNSFKEILLITGKGLHSKVENNIYVSKQLGKLRFSIPEYIIGDAELNSKVASITTASKEEGGEGAIIIKLKNL